MKQTNKQKLPGTSVPDANELAVREIIRFYQNASQYVHDSDGVMSLSTFTALCKENGLKTATLIGRLFAFLDVDKSDSIELSEVVRGINPLLRGSIEDVARMCFDIYDLDGNGELTAAGISVVYADMLGLRSSAIHTQCANVKSRSENVDTVMIRAMSQKFVFSEDMVIDNDEDLALEKIERIENWVAEQKRRHGKLDKEAFVKAVCELDKGIENNDNKGFFLAPRDICYGTAVLLFTSGGLWALLAVAAMTERFKIRHDIGDSQIGILNSAYFAAGIASPFIGGYIMDHYAGPGPVTAAANTITAIGALVQWLANSPEQYPLLVVGRFLIGFGLEITFFSVYEVIVRLWPRSFGRVVGMFGLQTSVTVFLAFLLLPKVADSRSDFDLDSSGTDFALLIVVAFCFLSTIASYIVVAAMKFENNKMIHSAQGATTTMFAAFGRAVIPREGDSILRTLIGLPPAFYLAVLGNKAINFFFNTFSLFSTVIYIERFGLSAPQASLATGLATLLAGLLSPFVGLGTDKFGKRSRLLAFASGVGLLAFLVLATTNASAVVWVGTALLAVLNSFVDTGLVTIPMIAGRSHAGVAYGVYGILGNTVDALISFVAGVILDSGENGSVTFIWFSVGVMLMGVFAWIGVCVLESRMSFIETPLDQIVETRNEHLFLATLSGVAGEDRPHSD